MLPLWNKGQLAFVPFAGSRGSHAQPLRNAGQRRERHAGAPRRGATPHNYGSGFLNRLASALDGAAPVSFTDGLPTVMTGQLVVPNVSLKGTGRAPFDDRQMAILAGMYDGTRFEPLIAEGFDLRKTVAEQAEMMETAAA